MALNPKYVTAPSLQEFFIDKDSGMPLSGGKVFFYIDNNRTTPKDVFEIQGSAANYTYSPLPNPVILSAVGTMADNNGNDIIPYYYPYDAEGNEQLYYIVVQNDNGVPQFTRPAWPNPNGSNNTDDNTLINYIPNGQFLAHTNLVDNALVAGSNVIAQGGWTIELDSGATSTNTLTFIEEGYTQDPPQSPRYVANLICTNPNALEVLKNIRIKFDDVNKFTDQTNTYAFWIESTFAVNASVQAYYFFGTGGSPSASFFGDAQLFTITPDGMMFNFDIDFGSNAGFTRGTNNDDYIAIDISLPTDITFNVSFTDFVLTPGTDNVLTGFPTQTDADMLSRGIFGWVDTPNPDGSNIGQFPYLTPKGMSWGVGSAAYSSKVFTTTGTFTTAATSSAATVYRIRGCGGGGGGGGTNGAVAAAGGGGSSVSFELTMSGIAASTAIAVTIGAGGAGGSTGANGSTGGSTVIATPVSITASGGLGGVGTSSAGSAGGAGGTLTASGTYLTIFSDGGQNGVAGFGVSNGLEIGGSGADTSLGQGGPGAAPNYNTAGTAATGYGAGGGGSINIATVGGSGSPGIVIIERMTQ